MKSLFKIFLKYFLVLAVIACLLCFVDGDTDKFPQVLAVFFLGSLVMAILEKRWWDTPISGPTHPEWAAKSVSHEVNHCTEPGTGSNATGTGGTGSSATGSAASGSGHKE